MPVSPVAVQSDACNPRGSGRRALNLKRLMRCPIQHCIARQTRLQAFPAKSLRGTLRSSMELRLTSLAILLVRSSLSAPVHVPTCMCAHTQPRPYRRSHYASVVSKTRFGSFRSRSHTSGCRRCLHACVHVRTFVSVTVRAHVGSRVRFARSLLIHCAGHGRRHRHTDSLGSLCRGAADHRRTRGCE
jgi:hypothetical protein